MAGGIAAGGIAAGGIAAGGIADLKFSILSLSLPSHLLRYNLKTSNTHGPHKHSMDAPPKIPKTPRESSIFIILICWKPQEPSDLKSTPGIQ